MARPGPEIDADERLLREAIRLSRARMRQGRGGPFGAVVARGGVIVARGWNAVTSWLDPTAHAEIVAIRRACRKLGTFELSGCVLYSSCEPCPMCLAAAYWARVERLVERRQPRRRGPRGLRRCADLRRGPAPARGTLASHADVSPPRGGRRLRRVAGEARSRPVLSDRWRRQSAVPLTSASVAFRPAHLHRRRVTRSQRPALPREPL